jgi:lipopolysaccharide/colanic/teichoic acid biosynthesis glycosyltransferase
LFPCLGVDEIAPSYAIVKRGIDILGAIVGLALSSPIWLGLWLKNTVDRSGPVLYAHTRVGKGGKPFQCYKFRTMVADADRLKPNLREFNQHEDHRTFKMANDPRITPVGKWLRKLSIDEMPQFLNVLKGDMSLVGPRPPIPSELKYYGEEDFCRLGVTPGLTCIWQVSGRSDLPFVEQLVMDIQYIENRSLWLDLQLIARTLPAICSCRGAR